MAVGVLKFDEAAPAGEKFGLAAREEIAEVAAQNLDPGDITTTLIDDEAVTTAKLAPGAVTTTKIATKGVKTVNIDDKAVDTEQIADDAVTPDQVGAGILTVYDNVGNPITMKVVKLTTAQFTALGVGVDPNTLYLKT